MKKLIIALLASIGLCALPGVASAQSGAAGSTAGISSTAALIVVGALVATSLLGEDDEGGVGSSGSCVGWACTNDNPTGEEEEE
ncbi:MAG: hypothetical protein ACO2ZB_02780, partial [Gammaproteobacteria bacterium]